MRPVGDVHQVFRLANPGLSRAEIARRVGINRATVRDWLDHGEAAVLSRPMRVGATKRQHHTSECGEGDRCRFSHSLDEGAYAYLLGQYLGDGCISRTTATGLGFRLRIACCNAYPNIMAECVAAIRSVVPGSRVGYIVREGDTEVYSTWFHWPCLFPQHDPGPKHTRPIELERWQREIALHHHPDGLMRGLIHSDGCRFINRVNVRGKTYEYVRYMFSNISPDILRLFLDACDQLDIRARYNDWNSISVARREAVARMDTIVGPKT
jgi:hypothetical protein